MKYTLLTDVESLKPLLDITINDVTIDLHNDFDCTSCVSKEGLVELYFKRIEHKDAYNEINAVLVFSGVIELDIDKGESMTELNEMATTLVNFAKGELFDTSKYYNDERVKYFFLGFENDLSIDLYCRDAIFILW